MGVTPQQVSVWAKAPWFPPRRRTRGWMIAEVEAAVEENVRRNGRPGPRATAPAPKRAKSPATAAPSSIVETLRSSSSDPVAIARAGLQVAAGLLADAVERGEGGRQIDGMKKALEELRRCEQGYLDLSREKREVVSVQTAQLVAAQIAQRACDMLDNVEGVLAAQVEVWLSEPAFRARTTEDRARTVRAWYDGQVRAAREVGAAEVLRLVDETEQGEDA